MKRHIPNILTIFRLILVPVFAWVILTLMPLHKGALIGMIIFIVASITDFFDGLIARRANLVSNFGKMMDPIADKVLVITALVLLHYLPGEMVPIWVLYAVVVREVLVTIMRQYHSRRGIYIQANIWGKYKAFLQMLGIIGALLYYTLQGYYPAAFAIHEDKWYLGFRMLFWGLALVTVASGITYVKPYQNTETKR